MANYCIGKKKFRITAVKRITGLDGGYIADDDEGEYQSGGGHGGHIVYQTGNRPPEFTGILT